MSSHSSAASPIPRETKTGFLNGISTPDLSRRAWFWLLAITVIGTVLRLAYQLDRPFIGDEIGTVMHLEKSYTELLTTWEAWLTFHYFMVVMKFLTELFGASKLVLVSVPMIFGVAAIPLTGLLARTVTSTNASLAAAVLVAINPIMLFHSVNIRPYSMLATLTLLMLILFAHWNGMRTYRRGIACAIALFFLNLMHPNGIYPVIALAAVCLFSMLGDIQRNAGKASWAKATKDQLRSWSSLAIPMALGCGAVLASYRHLLAARRGGNGGGGGPEARPTGLHHLDWTWSSYFGDGFLSWAAGALMLFALVRAIEQRSRLRLLVAIVFWSVVAFSLRGISHFPWAYSRWLLFTLPLLLIVVAHGIANLPIIGRRTSLTALAALLLTATWIPDLADRFTAKLDTPWETVRESLRSRTAIPNLAVPLGWGTKHNLGPPNLPGLQLEFLNRVLARAKPNRSAPPNSGHPVAVVVYLAEINCPAYSKSYGELTVLTIPAPSYTSFSESLRSCLLDSVQGTWPTEPEYAPVYQSILWANQFLRIRDNNATLQNLYRTTRARTKNELFLPPRGIHQRGEALSRKLQKTKPLEQSGTADN